MNKHPTPQFLRAQALYKGPVRSCLNHPVAFPGISADTIRQTIQQMSGSAGSSGLMSVAGRGFASHSAVHPCVRDSAQSMLTRWTWGPSCMPVDCPGQMSGRRSIRCWRMPKETNWESHCSMHQDGHTVCYWGPTALCVAHGWLWSCHPYTHRHVWDWGMWSHVIRGYIKRL